MPLVDGGTVRLPALIGRSRALDLILTGRPVTAVEAFDIGLVNRLAPPGGALPAARRLASDLAHLPQECLRNDRAAVLAGTMEDEYAYGVRSLAAGATEGAARFVGGEGRHGRPA